MDTGQCYLGLGLLLGVLIGALFAHGNARRVNARRKMDALKSERARAKGIVDKAIERRKEGAGEMPGALFLMVLAVVLFILTLYMLAGANGLF